MFSFFSLGTALLYRTAAAAATNPVQNGGKSLRHGFAAVSAFCKAGMKTLYPDFTNKKNMPKIPFSGWSKRQKSRRAFPSGNIRRPLIV